MSAAEEREQALAWVQSLPAAGSTIRSSADPEPDPAATVEDSIWAHALAAAEADLAAAAAGYPPQALAPAPAPASPTPAPLSADRTSGLLAGHGSGVLRSDAAVAAAREAMRARVEARKHRG